MGLALRLGPNLSLVLTLVVGCGDPQGPAGAPAPPSSSSSAGSATAPSSSAALPTATAVASAPPAPPKVPVDELEAKRLVAETAYAKRILGKNPDHTIILDPAANPPPIWHTLRIAPPRPAPGVIYPALRVKAATGEIEAQSSCEGKTWVPVAVADFEERALDALFALPEMRGLDRYLRKESGGTAVMTVRIEECPKDDVVRLYVGERTPTHTVRTFTVIVSGPRLEISVADLGGNVLPYARFKQTESARMYAGYGLPADKGSGPLGYGAPEKVVPVATFQHPTKAALDGVLELDRVEYYADGFPVFVGARASTALPKNDEIERVKKANYGFPFELVWDEGRRRLRTDGQSVSVFEGGVWKAP